MPEIQVLSSETIDQIAAGEVVERPASVVKELVENALDAGADAITVEIRDGGISMIRVTDNGCGVERDQVRKAFLRHSTSKIRDAADLAMVHSLGFRGEALSSIAAVSQVEIITKTADALTGIRFCIEGGEEKEFQEIGAPDGTTFIMRNLFFNTPVRKKFLKQAPTEGGYVSDLMEHLALSRPDVSFQFVIGSQTRFHTSGNGDLKEVIYRIYGREIAASLVPIQAKEKGFRLEGYLGQPILVRSNRNFEIYFVNGRFIRSNIIAKAVEEGYKEYLMQHKFPFCVLHFTLDTEMVDVNVHPTKMDVRFSNQFAVSEFIARSVKDVLVHKEMIPQGRIEKASEERERLAQERKALEEQRKVKVAQPFEQRRQSAELLAEESSYHAFGEKAQKSFEKSPVWERVREITQKPADKAVETAAETTSETKDAFFEETVEGKAADQGTLEELRMAGGASQEDAATRFLRERGAFEKVAMTAETAAIKEDIAKEDAAKEDIAKEDVAKEDIAKEGVAKEDVVKEDVAKKGFDGEGLQDKAPAPKQLDLFEEKILEKNNKALYRIIGQVFDTYWMFQYQDKLCILDQHAAHEKVKYERFMKRYREKEVLSQNLFPPVIVSLSGQEEIALREYWDVFARLGFEIESFGGNEFCLRSVPVDLYGCGERELFLSVLDELESGTVRQSPTAVEEKIASMSCKAAVKGNNRLSYEEADELIDELLTLENPYNCPHGRPTIITISKYEMEKKFKRIV